MSLSDHIKQQVSQDFFCQKDLLLLENGKTGFFCFTRVEEPAHHIENILPIWRHIVLICCTMCGTEQPKEQPQIGDKGSNPVEINQFLIFFSTGFTFSRSLFSLANILYSTWFTSFYLILL